MGVENIKIFQACSLMIETGFVCERMQVFVKTGISEVGDEWREIK